MKIPVDKLVIVNVDRSKLGPPDAKPEIAWAEPNRFHPYEGYAVLWDGDKAATATISALEWPKMDRLRIEHELKAYIAKYPEQCKQHLKDLIEAARAH